MVIQYHEVSQAINHPANRDFKINFMFIFLYDKHHYGGYTQADLP